MILLSLDISTAATGWSVFEDSRLFSYGYIQRPKIKGITKMTYPLKQLAVIKAMAEEIALKAFEINPDHIVIEEINRGRNRIGQKSLDALHFFVLEYLQFYAELVEYMDSDGRTGWRKVLDLKFTEKQKEYNKYAKLHNKKKGVEKMVVLNKKHLAQEYVKNIYKLSVDIDVNKYHMDLCDSICLGDAWLKTRH
jgi:hypothetical protein